MLHARPMCRGVDVAAVRRELLRLGVLRRAMDLSVVGEPYEPFGGEETVLSLELMRRWVIRSLACSWQGGEFAL